MKRRVTVHFGDVRVVVPCQNENTTVAELAEAAIVRYKKATGKVRIRLLTHSCFLCLLFLFEGCLITKSVGWLALLCGTEKICKNLLLM
ncbi:unnamed protein product [Haemonchus placei]|uniref:Par3_HAL_N_term domain-containing protein n=1 Tax=Haemonchus placei TaxID=6290 RepID=A0A0N4WFR9_HAEPC|nr:unnamed protein product [Haemonchus placei]